MWITRQAFDALNAERIKALEQARLLADQNAAWKITSDWLRVRLEQVERERAHLLKTYMGVVVQVPTFVKQEPSEEDIVGGANIFQDIGNDNAKRLGIEWDEDGSLKTKQ